MLFTYLSTSANLVAICLSLDLNLLQDSTLTTLNSPGPSQLNVSSVENSASSARNASNSTSEPTIFHSLDNTTHNDLDWYCDGQAFGQPNYVSCNSAYNQIPDTDTVESWGRRQPPFRPPWPTWTLPHRFISGKERLFLVPIQKVFLLPLIPTTTDDGTCAIDVDILMSHPTGLQQDSATARELKQAASRIIGDCVCRLHSEGGMATGLG